MRGSLTPSALALLRSPRPPVLPQPLASGDVREVTAELLRQGLATLVLQAIDGSSELRDSTPAPLLAALRDAQFNMIARTLAQDHAAAQLSVDLRHRGIAHVFFKGVQLRRTLYEKPWLRPSGDVDLLVSEGAREESARALCSAGFKNISKGRHLDRAWTFADGEMSVDLHWHLFRPGRVRVDPARAALETAVDCAGLPGMNPELSLAYLLVSTALGDYVTGKGVRAVDIWRAAHSATVRWPRVQGIVESLGLAPAAWLTATWSHGLLGASVPPNILNAWAPGSLQRGYLLQWLARDPHAVYLEHPNLARFAFSLALYRNPVIALPLTRRLLCR